MCVPNYQTLKCFYCAFTFTYLQILSTIYILLNNKSIFKLNVTLHYDVY